MSEKVTSGGRTTRRQIVREFIVSSPVELVPFLSDRIEPVGCVWHMAPERSKQRER